MWRLRPALPILTFWCSALPIAPTVARHSARTMRISPEGRRRVAMSPSLAISWIEVPAERRHLTAAPGLELDVVDDRTGRHARKREGSCRRRFRRPGPDCRTAPDREAAAERGCSASRRRRSAGARCRRSGWGRTRSRATFAGTPSLRRLKSISPVEPLGSAATVAGSLAATRVASAALLQALRPASSRAGPGDLGEVGVRHKAPPGACRLWLAYRMVSGLQARGPGRSGFARLRRPARSPSSKRDAAPTLTARRLGLDLTLSGTHSDDADVEQASTAWRIWVLWASGWTRKV